MFGFERFNPATTSPNVGEIVSVLFAFAVTEVTRPTTHTPSTEKQPSEILMPCVNEDVAALKRYVPEPILILFAVKPPENVEVAVLDVALKYDART